MTPLEIVRHAMAIPLTDRSGTTVELSLLPGLTDAEIERFAQTLPAPLPPEMRELLRHCRGFEGLPLVEQVDFTGELMFEFPAVFPHGLPIAADGCGNFWVVDLLPDARTWGPIYYASHDTPVILYQSGSLEQFFVEVFKLVQPPYQSEVEAVHADFADVWRCNPGVLSYEECRAASDPVLSAFAEELDPAFEIIDLRQAKPGDGFSWGRYSSETVIRRYGTLPVFAYRKPEPRRGLLQRLLGR